MAAAQGTTPAAPVAVLQTPPPAIQHGFVVHQTVDLGGHIVGISGSGAMYDTLVNIQSGPRVLGQTLTMHAVPGAKHTSSGHRSRPSATALVAIRSMSSPWTSRRASSTSSPGYSAATVSTSTTICSTTRRSLLDCRSPSARRDLSGSFPSRRCRYRRSCSTPCAACSTPVSPFFRCPR